MSRSIINGKVQNNSGRSASSIKIQKAGQLFRSKGYSLGSNNSDLFQANLVLNSLNITVSRETKSFTLSGAENKDKGIDNPSIIDPDLTELTPEPISAEDKFAFAKETDARALLDEFYEQDEDLTEKQKTIAEKQSGVKTQVMFKLASSICSPRAETMKKKSINKYTTKYSSRGSLDE